SQENVQDNISARLNKSALVSYRIAGLCALIEAAFDIAAEYLEEYVTFGAGETNKAFFHRAAKITERKYGLIIRKEQRLMIDTNICKRAHDVTVQNLAQYMALMKIHDEDKKNWCAQAGRTMKPMMQFITPEGSKEVAELKNTNEVLVNNKHNIDWPLTRKQENIAGAITEEVLETLRLERYQSLNIDLSSLAQRVSQENQNENLSHACSISTEENESIFSQNIITTSEAYYSIDQPQDEENIEHRGLNIFDLVDNFSGIGDQSNSSASQLVVVNEEIVEQQSEKNGVETITVSIC
ncbi:unnamed protein product, partial [Rotaria sordida]